MDVDETEIPSIYWGRNSIYWPRRRIWCLFSFKFQHKGRNQFSASCSFLLLTGYPALGKGHGKHLFNWVKMSLLSSTRSRWSKQGRSPRRGLGFGHFCISKNSVIRRQHVPPGGRFQSTAKCLHSQELGFSTLWIESGSLFLLYNNFFANCTFALFRI